MLQFIKRYVHFVDIYPFKLYEKILSFGHNSYNTMLRIQRSHCIAYNDLILLFILIINIFCLLLSKGGRTPEIIRRYVHFFVYLKNRENQLFVFVGRNHYVFFFSIIVYVYHAILTIIDLTKFDFSISKAILTKKYRIWSIFGLNSI